MKVLLVTLNSNLKARWMPLNILFLASSLRENGHIVKIVNRIRLSKMYDSQNLDMYLENEVESFQPDFVGINTISELIYDAQNIIDVVKRVCDAKIVLGGHHATSLPKLTLKKIRGVDYIITHEAENSLLKLVEGDPLEGIPGLCYFNEEFRQNAPDRIDDLDKLPFPAYDLLDMDYYLKITPSTIDGYLLKTISMITSRGCNYSCNFCSESLTYSNGVRYHSTAYIIRLINQLLDKYDFNGIIFYDNDFLSDRKRGTELLNEFINCGISERIKFSIQTRANHIDSEIVKLLKESGCVKIELGIETVSETLLGSINKGLTQSKYLEAIKICKDNMISVQANLIHGFESETLLDLDSTYRFIKNSKVDNWRWPKLFICPGTKLYDNFGNGFFENNEWAEDKIKAFYSKDHLSSIPIEEKNAFFCSVNRNARFRRRLNILKLNPIQSSIRYFAKRIWRRIC